MPGFSLKTLLSLTATAGLTLACGTARVEEESPTADVDAGVAQEEVVALGCVATIEYPPSKSEPAFDVLSYDQDGKLLRHERTFADGLYSLREWSWTDDGRTAVREWFDGSKVIRHDDLGRAIEALTYDVDGEPTWRETVGYDDKGLLSSRKLTRVSDGTEWMETTYQFDGYSIRHARSVSLVDPAEVRSIKFKFESQQDDVKMVQSHDIDGDDVTDFKTALLLTSDGIVERGVDAQGQLVDYDYEGDCDHVGLTWPLGDPFFVDM